MNFSLYDTLNLSILRMAEAATVSVETSHQVALPSSCSFVVAAVPDG